MINLTDKENIMSELATLQIYISLIFIVALVIIALSFALGYMYAKGWHRINDNVVARAFLDSAEAILEHQERSSYDTDIIIMIARLSSEFNLSGLDTLNTTNPHDTSYKLKFPEVEPVDNYSERLKKHHLYNTLYLSLNNYYQTTSDPFERDKLIDILSDIKQLHHEACYS